MNKFRIKSEIIAAIDRLLAPALNENIVKEVMDPLYSIEDTDFVSVFLINELFATNDGTKMDVIMFLMNELVSKQQLENKVFEMLNSELDDEKKYRLINLLRSHGKVMNYEMFSQYMTEPEKFINEDTKAFLENSKTNPELKIDFIDFINAIDEEDRDSILDSILDEYGCSESAEFLIPLMFSTTERKCLIKIFNLLAKTKSKKALAALNRISPLYENDKELKQIVKKSINMLKLSSGSDKRIIRGHSGEFMYKCFISIPDGEDNFGIIVSNNRKDDSVQMFSAAISLKTGVLDCFGFNEILKTDFAQIVNRFYKEEQKVEIIPEIAKMLLSEAEARNLSTKTPPPYEYLCWKEIMENVEEKEREAVFEYDNVYNMQLNEQFINNLFDVAPFLKTWFYNEGNPTFDVIFDRFSEAYKKSKTLTDAQLQDFTNSAYQIFNEKEEPVTFNMRLLLSAYLYKTSSNTIAASILYNIFSNEEYKEIFVKYLIQKSLYFRLKALKEKHKQQQNNSKVLVLNARTVSEHFDTAFLDSALKVLTGSLSRYE